MLKAIRFAYHYALASDGSELTIHRPHPNL